MLNKLLKLRGSQTEDGFTLIELMIVVVIIGVLAAIAIPIFTNQQKSAKDAALKSDIKNLAAAMTTWQSQGHKLTDAPYVNTTQYIMTINNGTSTSWPVDGTKKITNFPSFNVSEGARIGIKITDYSKGFCIAGAIDGGNYNSIDDDGYVSATNKMLYYDSAVGSIKTIDQLTPTGSPCSYFYKAN